jgi:hypothetical protein
MVYFFVFSQYIYIYYIHTLSPLAFIFERKTLCLEDKETLKTQANRVN